MTDNHTAAGTSASGRGLVPGLVKGLATTARTMLRPAHTAEYPDAPPTLPPRSRGVIALLQENCTSCMLCARECPDWCIYIDSHKETIPAETPGGRDRQRNVLDRFAIDFSLCMYCGICIEACPFDALFWSPQFEYAETDIRDLLHEKERLGAWMATVPPPPALDEHAADPAELTSANKPARVPRAGGAGGSGTAGAAARPARATRRGPGSDSGGSRPAAGSSGPTGPSSGPTRPPSGAGAPRDEETRVTPSSGQDTSHDEDTHVIPRSSGDEDTREIPPSSPDEDTREIPPSSPDEDTREIHHSPDGNTDQETARGARPEGTGRRRTGSEGTDRDRTDGESREDRGGEV